MLSWWIIGAYLLTALAAGAFFCLKEKIFNVYIGILRKKKGLLVFCSLAYPLTIFGLIFFSMIKYFFADLES